MAFKRFKIANPRQYFESGGGKMHAYSVTFDPNGIENSDDFEKIIKSISRYYIQPIPSQYIISSDSSAGKIRDILGTCIKQKYPLFVVRIDISDFASLHIDNRLTDALTPVYF